MEKLSRSHRLFGRFFQDYVNEKFQTRPFARLFFCIGTALYTYFFLKEIVDSVPFRMRLIFARCLMITVAPISAATSVAITT